METETTGQQSNRLFVILAIALIGLICIGLVGLTGVILITRQNRANEQIAVAVTPTLPAPTPTPTATITPTPTETPLPTPTSTRVVNSDGQPAGDQVTPVPGQPGATPTNTLVVQPLGTPVAPPTPIGGIATAPAQMPNGGGVLPGSSQALLIWAAVGMLVLLTVGAVNYLKRA